MNTAAELLKALRVSQIGERPPPGWFTLQELATEANLSRARMGEIIKASPKKVERRKFKVPGVKNPMFHYKLA